MSDTDEIVDLALGGLGTFEVELAINQITTSNHEISIKRAKVISLDLSFSIIDHKFTKANWAFHYLLGIYLQFFQ